MKELFKWRLSVVATLLSFTLSNLQAQDMYEIETPDFDFPKDVMKDAERDLKKGLAAHDQKLIVRSLINHGLAQTSISRENIDQTIGKIDSVLQVGKLEPDYQALLWLVKARVYADSEWNPYLNTSSDVAERKKQQTQCNKKAIEILTGSGKEYMTKPVEQYTGILNLGNELGKRSIPSIFDFAAEQLESDDSDGSIRQARIQLHKEDQDIMPMIYLEGCCSGIQLTSEQALSIYQKYARYDESALILKRLGTEDKYYQYYCDYQKEHPHSVFNPEIKNLQLAIEEKWVTPNYAPLLQSSDSICVTTNIKNVNECELTLYKIPNQVWNTKKDMIKVKDLIPIDQKTVKANGTIPFLQNDIHTTFAPKGTGRYVVLASFPTPKGKIYKQKEIDKYALENSALIISDIRGFFLGNKVFVVDSHTGQPIPDAVVKLGRRGLPRASLTFRTNKDGFVAIGSDSNESYIYGDISISNGADDCTPEVYFNYHKSGPYTRETVAIHTDLNIYRPGETIRMSIIAYSCSTTSRKPLPSVELEVTLEDASHKKVNTQKLTTDNFGQATCEMEIPTDRMNGNFTIRVSDGGQIHSSHIVSVSEYKTPTFYVDLSDTRANQFKDGKAAIKGRVMSYSGLPVANTTVKCTLSREIWWRYWGLVEESHSHEFSVTTDAEGHFEYDCPEDWTQSNAYYTYQLSAICTNTAGETHEAQTHFWMGSNRGIQAEENTYKIDGNKPVEIAYSYNSTAENETSVICRYTLLTQQGKVAAEGSFDIIKEEKVDWHKLASGSYRLRLLLDGDADDKSSEATVVLYRESDKQPPVEGALWIPKASQSVTASGNARFLIGNRVESYFYYTANSRDKVESEGWVHYTPGMHWMELPIPAAKDEILDICIYCINDGKISNEKLHFNAPAKNEVKVNMVSFRDKLQPGSREHWTFSLSDAEGKPAHSRMLLELYNLALEKLSSNRWSLGAAYCSRNFSRFRDFSFYNQARRLYYSEVDNSIERQNIELPNLEFYGNSFFEYRGVLDDVVVVGYGTVRKNGLASTRSEKARVMTMADSAPMMAKASNIIVAEEAETDGIVGDDGRSDDNGFDNIELRTDEVKVALWAPQLTTDAEGNISLEWDVPNFNTTWCMQALAYDKSMASSLLTKTILVQRPLMVQPSLPRFLRAGDQTELAANVMNASDEAQTADVLVELFDPRTDKVIKSQRQTLSLESKETKVVTIGYNAPAEAPYIGFRIKALDKNGNGDGEQQMLPILTNISPVIETAPFFMNPDQLTTTLEVKQPKAGSKNNRLTLEYCNNPIWYCITALPTIADESTATSIGVAHKLYAIALASYYAKQNPFVLEVINEWKQQADSASNPLISRLRQDADLKITSLLASPWLPEAERQELRMAALEQLFSQSLSDTAIGQLIERLNNFHRPDGGFAWIDDSHCPISDHKSSYWATGVVLQLAGELDHLNSLPKNEKLHLLIAKAISYYDKETVKLESELLKEFKEHHWNKSKADKSRPSYLVFMGYAYIRSLFKDSDFKVSESLRNSRINKRILEDLAAEWNELSYEDKAFAAITLHRGGKQQVAKRIMESIRQFAICHPTRGMYWENVGRWSWHKPVAITTTILEAFAEIDPRQKELDEIRKWILLDKQTSDWGGSSMAANVVYTLLSTGSDWLSDTPHSAKIHLGGNHEDIILPAEHLGYTRFELPADVKQVSIEREGNQPAWGAIYHQYAAPMKQIEAQHIDEVRIEKEIVIEGNVAHIRLKVVNTKALEYLVIKDERPACLEPVDQTSGYHWQRGLYYQESKDQETRFFINRLEAGSHSYEYDCYVTNPGNFSCGIATIQSMYAPQMTAHSAGSEMKTEVEK